MNKTDASLAVYKRLREAFFADFFAPLLAGAAFFAGFGVPDGGFARAARAAARRAIGTRKGEQLT